MIRTLMACLFVLSAFASATAALTHGFTWWTFESVRRAEARAGRLVAAPIDVIDSENRELALWAATGDPDAIFIVDFVYTHCITVCQALGPEFARMQALVAANPASRRSLRLASLSLDVERDGSAELGAYARRNHADPAIWSVAAPRSLQTSAQLMRQLGVIAIPDGFGGFVHNGTIHVIDGRGVVRGIYDTAGWRDALAAASALAESRP